MYDYHVLRPFRFWCQKVLPLVYDNSLSYYEVLCKVVEYLNNMITDTQNVVAEIEELREQVENLDTDITDAVNEELQRMLQDGELEDILDGITDTFIDEMRKNFKSSTLAIGRIGRFLDHFGEEGTRRLYGQSIATDDTYFYICGANSGNTAQTICKADYNGVIVGHNSYSALGHANDIFYQNGKLYVANGAGNTLAIIDAVTLNLDNAITLSTDNVIGVSGDATNIYLLYRTGTNYYVGRYAEGSVTQLFRVYYDSYNVVQGMCYYNNEFYIVANHPDMMRVYGMDGTLNRILYVPLTDGYFPVGELETAVVYQGRFCIFSSAYAPVGDVTSNATAVFSQLFATSITENVPATFDYPRQTIELAVNGNGTYVFNPTNTFTTMEEASYLACWYGRGNISFSNTNDGLCVLINGTYSVRGTSGNRYVSYLHVSGASAVITTLLVKNHSFINSSIINVKNFGCGKICEVFYSEFYGSNVSTESLTNFKYRRSNINIEEFSVNVPSGSTFTREEVTSGKIRFTGKCVEYLNKILSLPGNGALLKFSIPNSTVEIACWISITKLFQDEFTAATNNTAYPSVRYANGVYYLVHSGGTEYNTVTSICYLEALAF